MQSLFGGELAREVVADRLRDAERARRTVPIRGAMGNPPAGRSPGRLTPRFVSAAARLSRP